MKAAPPSVFFLAVVAVKPQLNYYLYSNCTYGTEETSLICYEKILISHLRSTQVIPCSLYRVEVGLGVDIVAVLVQYDTLITVLLVVEPEFVRIASDFAGISLTKMHLKHAL